MIFRRRRRRFRGLDEKVDEAPMTPMIDIVFQLLIFFMLTMQFKEVEGKLISQLPKTKGMKDVSVKPEFKEIRIVLCADGDTEMHLTNKGRHEKTKKDPGVCTVMVEQIRIGQVHRTENAPEKGSANSAVYRAMGAKVAELRPLTPTRLGNPVPVILDADGDVPYEHIIGAVNACKELNIHNIEFVGNSKFTRYYGK